jgi:hypothetical protein
MGYNTVWTYRYLPSCPHGVTTQKADIDINSRGLIVLFGKSETISDINGIRKILKDAFRHRICSSVTMHSIFREVQGSFSDSVQCNIYSAINSAVSEHLHQ